MPEFFREISSQRRLVEKHQKIFQLFRAAFEVTDQQNKISILQKEFILTELCFSYRHFGFALFSLSAVNLIQQGLSCIAGISPVFIQEYLQNIKKYLDDEIKFEKKEIYFSEKSLEISFAKELVKRIYCTETHEDMYNGLFVFEHKYIETMRKLARDKITKLAFQASTFSQEKEDEMAFAMGEEIYHEFYMFAQFVKADPLFLIVSRFESFVHFPESDLNTIFAFKENNSLMSGKSKKIAAILTLLAPYKNAHGEIIFKDNLLTINQIAKLFSTKFKSSYFNLQIIKEWFHVEDETKLKAQLEFLMEDALKCGVVFKIPQKNQNFYYGLSANGMKIIQPFHAILSESLVLS